MVLHGCQLGSPPSLGHAISLITARQNAPAGTEDDNAAGLTGGRGAVEVSRRSQIVVLAITPFTPALTPPGGHSLPSMCLIYARTISVTSGNRNRDFKFSILWLVG